MRCSHERASAENDRKAGAENRPQHCNVCAMQGSISCKSCGGAARSKKYARRKTSRDNHGLGGKQQRDWEGGGLAGKPAHHHRLISRQKREGQNVPWNHCESACLTSDVETGLTYN